MQYRTLGEKTVRNVDHSRTSSRENCVRMGIIGFPIRVFDHA